MTMLPTITTSRASDTERQINSDKFRKLIYYKVVQSMVADILREEARYTPRNSLSVPHRRRPEEIYVKIDPHDGHRIIISIFDRSRGNTPRNSYIETEEMERLLDTPDIEAIAVEPEVFEYNVQEEQNHIEQKNDKEDVERPTRELGITEECDQEGRPLSGKRR